MVSVNDFAGAEENRQYLSQQVKIESKFVKVLVKYDVDLAQTTSIEASFG